MSHLGDAEQSDDAGFNLGQDGDRGTVACYGSWTITQANHLDEQLAVLSFDGWKTLTVDTSRVHQLDTAGAWLIERMRMRAKASGLAFHHSDPNAKHTQLVSVVRSDETDFVPESKPKRNIMLQWLWSLGRFTTSFWQDFLTMCFLIGASIRGPQMKAGRRGGIRLKSIIHHLDQMGLRAVPVIAVMSFLIGAIIAQQGAFQLKAFGEELLTVNLVGVLHFREIAVLLTAVMVAGRTGSAITAEVGTMKMREEIDALTVIGLNPIGVLIFPRLVALIIAVPILVLLSDIMGIAGAIFISSVYVGIPPEQFLTTLQSGVPINHLIVGLIKAPIMAVIIGLAASVEGLKVGGSAESLGKRTTSSVVRAIFAVILADGIFAMFFTAIGY